MADLTRPSDNIDYDEVNKAFVNLGDTAAWCLQAASTLKKFTAEQKEIVGDEPDFQHVELSFSQAEQLAECLETAADKIIGARIAIFGRRSA